MHIWPPNITAFFPEYYYNDNFQIEINTFQILKLKILSQILDMTILLILSRY